MRMAMSTLISVYSDSAGTVAATNPIVADADGFGLSDL